MRASLSVTAGVLSVVVAGLLLAAAPSAQSDRAIEVSRNHFAANRGGYGLNDPGSDLRVRSAHSDSQGLSHVRFDQFYRGLRVFEGEAIAHVDANGDVTVTNSLHGNLNLDTNPRVNRTAAVATAVRSIGPLGAYELRDAALVVLPRGERSIIDRLAWQVAIDVDNDFEDRAEWQDFIDARTGDVAFSYNGLETTGDVMGTGKTMSTRARSPSISTRQQGRRLSPRPDAGQRELHLRHAKRPRELLLHHRQHADIRHRERHDDGSDRRRRRALRLRRDLGLLPDTFGRNGIDGAGRKTYSRVHYGTQLRQRVLGRLLLLHDLRRRRRRRSTRWSRSTWPATRCRTASCAHRRPDLLRRVRRPQRVHLRHLRHDGGVLRQRGSDPPDYLIGERDHSRTGRRAPTPTGAALHGQAGARTARSPTAGRAASATSTCTTPRARPTTCSTCWPNGWHEQVQRQRSSTGIGNDKAAADLVQGDFRLHDGVDQLRGCADGGAECGAPPSTVRVRPRPRRSGRHSRPSTSTRHSSRPEHLRVA